MIVTGVATAEERCSSVFLDILSPVINVINCRRRGKDAASAAAHLISALSCAGVAHRLAASIITALCAPHPSALPHHRGKASAYGVSQHRATHHIASEGWATHSNASSSSGGAAALTYNAAGEDFKAVKTLPLFGQLTKRAGLPTTYHGAYTS